MKPVIPGRPQHVRIRIAGITDTGQRRNNNEDNILVDSHHSLAIVADGMGGHNAGEVASQLAIDVTSQFLIAGIHIEAKSDDAFSTPGPLKVLMEKSIQQANRKIVDESGGDDKKSGMGTTIACLLFCGSWFVIGNVGDSRCYRFRDGKIKQLSTDHSWIQGMVKQGTIKLEDAKRHPQRALLLQALGNREIEPSFISGCPQPGDVFVLCSDGLTEVVSNNTIGFVLNQDGGPQKTAEKLVELANENGGPDNISVVVAKVLPPKSHRRPQSNDADAAMIANRKL
ncbi:MAG: Stp1/IreP family PP2C-type Ser/Thr phosphatase [Gammaproteobacteria bacterium]|nr:Stp1/IreP family PP2C-type Ser/Thr phosphatase [Gammaproteobacteria bacterium]MDX2488316.1 Stp1/IreP family PP2C-type Ser/Thr phosphatase [Gammaproteobacteria bacterium]